MRTTKQAPVGALGNKEAFVTSFKESGTYRSLLERLEQRDSRPSTKKNQSQKSSNLQGKSAKVEGYELRAAMRDAIWGSKMSLCGFAANNGLVGVEASSSGSSRLSHGQKCKKSLCPVCGFEKDTKRAEEIKVLFEVGQREGWKGWFFTLTFSHQRREAVKAIGDDLQKCWRKTYQSLRKYCLKHYGFQLEFENSLDFTYGGSGCHFHYHGALIHRPKRNKEGDSRQFMLKSMTQSQEREIKKEFKRLWADNAAKLGRKVSGQVGVVLRQLEFNQEGLADYIAKTGLFSEAKEIANRTTKSSKSGYGLRDIHREVAKGSRIWIARFKELTDYFHHKKVHNRSKELTRILKQELASRESKELEQFHLVFTFNNKVLRAVEKKKLLYPILKVASDSIRTGNISALTLKVGALLKSSKLEPDRIAVELKKLFSSNLETLPSG